MTRLTAIFGVLAFAAWSGTAPCPAQEEVPRAPVETDGRLQWIFSPGQVLVVDTRQSQDLKIQFGQRAIETFHQVSTTMRTTVDAVDDEGVASASSRIERMQLVAEAPGMQVDFDSASPDKPAGTATEIAQLVQPIMKVQLQQTMTPTGQIRDVRVPPEALAGFAGAHPTLSALVRPKSIANMVSQGALEFPQTNPEVGFQWQTRREQSTGNPMVIETAYMYLGVVDIERRPLHLIQAIIKVSYPEGFMGGPVEITEEDARARYYFDGVAGHLVKSEMNQDISFTVQARGQTIRQTQQQKVTVQIREAE